MIIIKPFSIPHLPIKPVSFAGISLSRVFFVTHDSVANYDEYITVNLSDSNDVLNFRDDTKNNEIVNLSFECGFMYYYKKNDDSTYSLCRQKFGSDNVVTLVDNCSVTDYSCCLFKQALFRRT